MAAQPSMADAGGAKKVALTRPNPNPDPNPDPNPNQVGASTPGRDANPPNPDPDPNPHPAQVLRQDGMQMAQVG